MSMRVVSSVLLALWRLPRAVMIPRLTTRAGGEIAEIVEPAPGTRRSIMRRPLPRVGDIATSGAHAWGTYEVMQTPSGGPCVYLVMGTMNEERCLAVGGEAEESEGTVEDFDAFYRTHFRSVVGLVYTLSGSRWGAEELAQEAFLAAHRRWHDIRDYDDPGVWVRRVALNRAVSRFRRRGAEARALARYTAGRRNLPDAIPPLAEDFWSAVRSLPDRQAQVVALHYLEDRPVADIALVLGLSEGTVKAHLHRARQSLAKRFGEAEEGL